MNVAQLKNNQSISIEQIPLLDYKVFMELNTSLVLSSSLCHCVNYYGIPNQNKIELFCCVANDSEHLIYVSRSVVSVSEEYSSFTALHYSFEKFEREIHENFGIQYTDHPWLKPVRYAFNRYDREQTIANYPFFRIKSEELHEVGVGPIHAGVIEPGHFRFICNGEQVPHLEIQLGFQHRGIENLFLQKTSLLQRATLAESIAGDTVCGHTIAFCNLWESLCGFTPAEDLKFARTLALELERIAMHTADLSALCTDVAYQLGSSVYGRLRTPIINYFQQWCGNRLAKGLIRVGGTHFPFTPELGSILEKTLEDYERDFAEMNDQLYQLPSVLIRFEKTGVITREQAQSIGTVGMSARITGLSRDIRLTHPHDEYLRLHHHPVLKETGDVLARVQMRSDEILQSLKYINSWISLMPENTDTRPREMKPAANMFTISMTEGWRGEICHCSVTDENGNLHHYKIKDPSFHNWLALALALRNNEISDFPVNNKSFNLSYCGNDL